MRNANHEVKFLSMEDGTLAGVSLGYDHCAEHEFGTKGIRASLGVTQGIDEQKAYTDYPAMADQYPESLDSFRVTAPKLYVIKGTLALAKSKKPTWIDKKALDAKKLEFGEAQKAATGKKTVKWLKSAEFLIVGSYQYDYQVTSMLEVAAREVIRGIKAEPPSSPPEMEDIFTKETSAEGIISITPNPIFVEKFYEKLTAYRLLDAPVIAAYRPSTKWAIKDLASQWAGDQFELSAVGEMACAKLAQVLDALICQKAFYGLTPVTNPFGRGGPLLMLEDAMSADEVNAINSSLISAKQKAECIHNEFNDVLTALNAKSELKGSIRIEKTEENGWRVWFNPYSPKLNYGWFTKNDLVQLLESKGPIIKTQE